MRLIFGIWTMIVALTVSVVAAYYSIVGLTAIFAAAVIPIIIMGATLEIAKVTAAVWLHSFWQEGAFLTKAYLVSAVVILMFITSMGIFGFLSKAHIEQAANSGGLVAQIERVDQEISREQQIIERANIAITGYGERVESADTGIQRRIEAQERLIADISDRLERDIATQNQIISQSNNLLAPLQQELERIEERRNELRAAQASGDVVALQALVGADPDGVLGPQTQQSIQEFQDDLDTRRTETITQLERVSNTDDPAVVAARAEITRLQQAANAEIARAQEAINAFREQLVSVTTQDNTSDIQAQEETIRTSNERIDELLDRKFELQGELRVLETEVGPVRYVAELVYGDTNTELLEEAVRWVIIIIVLVFDPLAIVLVLAGLSILHPKQTLDNDDEVLHNENNETSDESSEGSVQGQHPQSPSSFADQPAKNLSEVQKDIMYGASTSETQDAKVKSAPSEKPKGRATGFAGIHVTPIDNGSKNNDN